MLSQWMLGRYKGNVGRVRDTSRITVISVTEYLVYTADWIVMLNVVQINGLMESWLIRRRGGKPMDKSMMCTVGGYS